MIFHSGLVPPMRMRVSVLTCPVRQSSLVVDPGHGEPIPATTRIHPFPRTALTVLAELALGICRRSPLTSPDGEGVPLELVDVIEGVTRVGVEATLYLLAWLITERL